MAPSSSRPPAICLVSGHQIVLGELKRILEPGAFDLTSVKISDAKAAQQFPAAALFVIDAEGVVGAVASVVSQISNAHPSAQMLVVSEQLTEEFAFPLLNMGVKGLITLDVMGEQLQRAAEALIAGGFWVPRGLLAIFVDSVITRSRQAETSRPAGAEVSRREQDIMDGLLLNLSNKEIASRLNISERTVKFHVSNLLAKFSVQRRADLILLWYQQKSQNAGAAAPRRIQ